MMTFGTTFGGFGGGVGSASNTVMSTTGQPGSGFVFGTPATTAAAAAPFSFGGGFGTTAPASVPASTVTGFGGFGMGASTVTTAPSGFSFGSQLGVAAPSTSTFGGFGTGGFGAPAAGTAMSGGGLTFGGFGANTTTTAAPASTGFSFGNTLGSNFGMGTSTGGFGATQTGGLFGRPATSTFGTPGMGMMQAPGMAAQATGAPQVDQNLTNLTTSLFCPVLYGDERDTVLAKWNQLQAAWGTGKGFYAIGAAPVDYTTSNPYCKFKAVGYSCLPAAKNEDGFVTLLINRKESDVRAQQPQLVEGIHRVLGSSPTLSVCVEGVKSCPDNRSDVTIYVIERANNGVTRRIPTSTLNAAMNQANSRQQLGSMGVEALVPKAKPSPEQLTQYLDNPPSGVDPLVWHQARLDNPDTEHLIPVPMVGFAELQKRLRFQEEETKVHQGRLTMISGEIRELENNHTNTMAKISEHKQKHLELSRRILKVMVRQEIGRKLGLAVQADEEQLRVQLERTNAELSAPNQAKGRLNELMSRIRLQKEHMITRVNDRYNVSEPLLDELKQHLAQQQESLSHLVSTIKENFECLKLMEEGLTKEAVK